MSAKNLDSYPGVFLNEIDKSLLPKGAPVGPVVVVELNAVWLAQ